MLYSLFRCQGFLKNLCNVRLAWVTKPPSDWLMFCNQQQGQHERHRLEISGMCPKMSLLPMTGTWG